MIPHRIVLVVLGGLMLQTSLVPMFSFDGARPEILIAIVLAVGHRIGPDEGLVVGLGAGLAFDVFLTTPFGFTALTYLIAGHAMGRLVPAMPSAPRWLTSLVLGGGSAAVMLAQGLVGEVIGLDTLGGPPIGTVMVLVGLVNLIIAPVVLAAIRWARIESGTRRRSSVYA